jgi:hypothetical protein
MSTNMQSEMSRVVASFVAEITEIAKRAARDQLDAAFGGSGRGGRAAASGASLGGGRGRGRGVKRTSGDLEKLADKFYEFVKANPGLRIEQINQKLGTSTKDLQLPIRKMISEGSLKAKGKKRSTTYTAGPRKKD